MSPEFDLSDPDAAGFCPSCGSGYTPRVTRCAPCGVALVLRGQIEAGPAEPEPPDLNDSGESTIALCQFDEPAKASVLGLELEQAGVPYWMRPAPFDPVLDLTEVAKRIIEFRVPAKYIEEARSALARVEEQAGGQPTDDGDAED